MENLRVVVIGDNLDLCPCAGTHIQNISEIGGIEFLGKKSKGKGTQRFSYTLK
ncbi:MAG: Alanine--tRNA ligase [Methanobacteriota archaeon]|nr:MAG: Alanine--tRNA ligase [Euryarchaeota archaeon]